MYNSYYQKRDDILIPKKAILLQCLSLSLTIVLGILIFINISNNYIFEIFLIAFFLSGPIYSINLPYLLKMVDKVEEHIMEESNYLKSKIRYYQQQQYRLPPNLSSNITSITYLITNELSEFEHPRISKTLIIISFFTPLWPITFYYLHYYLNIKLQKHVGLSNEIYQLFNEMEKGIYISSRSSGKKEIPMQNSKIYAVIAIISIIGFGMIFLEFCAGFFGIFWTFILLSNINKHHSMHEKKYSFPGTTQKISSIKIAESPSLSLLFLSFFCFGATAGFIALFTNTFYAGTSLFIPFIRPTTFILFLVAFIAPVVEESAKVSALFLYKEKLNKLPIFYWVLFGMAAGLGFALLEDYVYFQSFYLEFSTKISLNLLILRLLFPVHLLASAVAGLGVGIWHKTDNFIYLMIFLLLAMFIHGSFNFIVAVGVS